jgi:hypothetical protein
MFVNIIIATALAIVAALVSGLAGHLAATKVWQKWFFWGCGAVMIILIFIQTYRNEMTQAKLQAQLATIQKNTEQLPQVTVTVPPSTPPTIVVNPPSRSGSGGFLQFELTPQLANLDAPLFAVGMPLKVNIFWSNRTNEAVIDAHTIEAGSLISEIKDQDATDFKAREQFLGQARRWYKGRVSRKMSGETIGAGNSIFQTAHTDSPLTSDQLQALLNGTTKLYIVGWAHWKTLDGTEREDEECRWLQPPSTPNIKPTEVVWHFCAH